jgi:type VI secretion system secreted protein VgrG
MFLQDQRLLEVKTSLGANALMIQHFSGSELLSGIFRFNLELLAEESVTIDQRALLHQSVLVTMRNEGSKRYFHGIVSKINSGSHDERFRYYHLEVVPWFWLLTHKTHSRIFQDKTVIQIIESVFNDLNKSFPQVSFRDATTESHISLDYCVQYRETDFNFVSRLMEQEGIFYFFEHTENNHTMVFADTKGAIAKCPGQSQVLYEEGGIGEREGIITYWQEGWTEVSGRYSLRDHHFQLPSKSLEVSDEIQADTANGLEQYQYPGEFTARFNKPEQRLGLVEQEGEKRIRIRMEQELSEEVHSSGRSTRPNLTAGHRFTLSKHFRCDGDYILTEVHHSVAQSPDYISGGVSNVPYRNKFTCLPASAHIRPRRVTSRPVIPGPQTAVVAVKSGEESWLDKFGRVRVQFFWDREGKDNETSACWVRVAQKWAGTGWGAHFWPRIGQEVVVEFLEGDPDRPLITGSVYNIANMPPYPLPENYTRSGIVSASSKYNSSTNFNELRFEDKTGQEQIFINAERDMDWRVEHDHREFVGNNRDLIVKAAQTELIEGNKHEHVKGEHTEKIDGNASREVGGSDREQIAGKLSLQVQKAEHRKIGNVYTLTADEIHLKSNQRVVIDSQRVSLKGPGGFVDIGPSGVAIQGIVVNINCGGSAGTGTPASPDPPAIPSAAQAAVDVTARVGRSIPQSSTPPPIPRTVPAIPATAIASTVMTPCATAKANDGALVAQVASRTKQLIGEDMVTTGKQPGDFGPEFRPANWSACQSRAADMGPIVRRFNRYSNALPYARASADVNELGDKSGSQAKAKPCLTRLPDSGAALSQALGLPPGTITDTDLRDDASGFRAAVYRSETDGQLILVARDTEPNSLVDWKTNIDNGNGKDTKQYLEMRTLAGTLSAKGVPFNLAGYSKGGGLAQEAGLVDPQSKIYVFNSAGLSDVSLTRTGNTSFNSLAQRTQSFSADGDFLTYMNNTTDPTQQIANAQYLRNQLEGSFLPPNPISIDYRNPATLAAENEQKDALRLVSQISAAGGTPPDDLIAKAMTNPDPTFASDKQSFLKQLDNMIANAKQQVAHGQTLRLFPPVRTSNQETIPDSSTWIGRRLGANDPGPSLGKLYQHKMDNVLSSMEDVAKKDRKAMQDFLKKCG